MNSNLMNQMARIDLLEGLRANPGIDNGSIYCFQRFLVYGVGQKNALRWRTSKTEELFALLVENKGKIISKSKIIQALWPEFDEDKSIVYLHATVYNLKQALLSAKINFQLIFYNGGYQLTLPDAYIDTAEFISALRAEHLPSTSSVQGYELAFSLYKGRYMEENEYSWSQCKSDEYAFMYQQLVATMYEYYIGQSDYSSAESILQRALTIDPIDDSFNEMLLALLLQRNDKAAFVRQYNKIKAIYNAELGISLNSSMHNLYKRAMEQSF